MARPDLNTTVGADTRPLEKNIRAALNKNYKVSLQSKGFSQPLGKIKGQLGEFEKSLDASNARVLAFGASAGAIVAVQQALKATVASAINVEKKLKDINVLLGASSKSIASFGSELFKIASQTGQSFDAVASAAAEFARQGLGLEKTLLRTRDALVLTRLSGLDVLSSVSSLTAAINSFSRAALNSTEIVNKLANVDASFAVSSADLANALSRVGSAAQDAGVSFDELLAIVTSAQQTTARGGAVIGNSLKTIFTRIQRPKVLDELEKLGVTVRNLEGETRPAIQILGELAKTFEGLSSTQKSQVGELVGGVFQINILKAALSDLNKEYSVYDNALQTSIGSTDQALKRNEALNETLSALINKTFVNLQKSGAKVGESAFGSSIRFVLENLNKALEGGDAESAGEKFGQAVFRGLGKFISGPGLVIAGSALIKIFVNLARFSADAFKTIQNLNIQSAEQRKLQAGITSILDDQPVILEKIRTGELKIEDAAELVLERYKTQQTILRQNLDIVKQIQSRSGVKVKAGKAGKAAGYIPNYFSDSDKREEEQTAMMLGATSSVKAKKGKGKIGGKSFLMNNQEVEITNFGKNGDSAVIPTYAGGYIPNFSSIREAYTYPFRMMVRGYPRPVARKDVAKNSREYELQLLKGGLASLGFTDAKDLNSIFGPNVQADFLAKKGGVPYLIDAKAGYNDAKLSQMEKKGATIAALRKTQPYKNYIQSLGINDADVRTAIIFGNAEPSQEKTLRDKGILRRAGGYVPNFLSKDNIPKSYKSFVPAKVTLRKNSRSPNGVYDGDSLSVYFTPAQEPIEISSRLIGADAYELNSKNKEEREKAKQGKRLLEERIKKTFGDGEDVTPLFAAANSNLLKQKEKYGRPFFKDDVYKNQLIKAGLGVSYDAKPGQERASKSLTKKSKPGQERATKKSKPKGKAKGFIPNFAEDKNQKALQEAVGRESSRRPLNSVRVSQVPAFRSKENPQGFVVTNTKDEPNGPSDLFARGYVPNFGYPLGNADKQIKQKQQKSAAIATAEAAAEEALNDFENNTRKSSNKFLILSLVAPQVVAQLENFAGESNKAVQSVDSLVAAGTTTASGLESLAGIAGDTFGPKLLAATPYLAVFAGLGAAAATFIENTNGVSSFLGDLEKSLEKQKDNLNKLNESTSKYLTTSEALNSALASGTADAKTLTKLYGKSADAIRDLPSSIKSLVLAGSDTESIKEAFAKAQQEQQQAIGRTSLITEIAKEAKGTIPGTIKNVLEGDGKFAESLGSSLIKDANVVVEAGEFGFKVSEELTRAFESGSVNNLVRALGYTGSEADNLAKVLGEIPFAELAATIQAATQAEIQRNKETKAVLELQKKSNGLLKPYKDRVAEINAELKNSSVDLKAIAGNFTDLGGLEKKSKELNKILTDLATGRIKTDKGRVEAVARASQLATETGRGRLNRDFVTRVAGRSFERVGRSLAASRRRFAPAFEGGDGGLGTGREAGRALLEQALGIENGKSTEEFRKMREGSAGLTIANEALEIATNNVTRAQQSLFTEVKDGSITIRKALAKLGQVDLNRPVVGSPNALGFVPNFSAAASERAQAKMGGYNAGAITKVNIPGVGNVTANSAETVKQFPGMSQPAIMPPSFSNAGRNYKKVFSAKHGFNPYAAQGFVPNFATQTNPTSYKLIKDAIENGKDVTFKRLKGGELKAYLGNNKILGGPLTKRDISNLDRHLGVSKEDLDNLKPGKPLKTNKKALEKAKKSLKRKLLKLLKRGGRVGGRAGGAVGSLASIALSVDDYIKAIKDDNKVALVPELASAGIAAGGTAAAVSLGAGTLGGLLPGLVAGVSFYGGDVLSEKIGLKDILERAYAELFFDAPSRRDEERQDKKNRKKIAELAQKKLARQQKLKDSFPFFGPYISFKHNKLTLGPEVFTEDGSKLKEELLDRYSKELSEISGLPTSFNDTFLLSPEGVLDKNNIALFATDRYASNPDFQLSVGLGDSDPTQKNWETHLELGQAYGEALARVGDSDPRQIGQKISTVKGIRSRVQRQLLNYTGRNSERASALLEMLESEFTSDFLQLYKTGKISPAQRDAILERARSVRDVAAEKRASEFRYRRYLDSPGTLDLASGVNAEGLAAFGFIPNLAGGEALARKTERSLAGSAIRSFDPRIGTYYRSAGQPSNLNALIRRDHPEGLSQAIRNSYSAQHGATPNFAADTSKAMEDLTVQIQELVSLLKENGQLDQAAAQTVQNTLDFTNNIGDINIEVDANQILANFQAAVAEMERKLMTVLKDNPIIGQSVRSQYA